MVVFTEGETGKEFMLRMGLKESLKLTFDPRWYLEAYGVYDIITSVAMLLFEHIHTLICILSPRKGAKLDIILTTMFRGW